jgi:hypothetical protein
VEETIQQFNILMGINGFTALIWFIAAISAYSRYRGFKQFADLGWTVTFVLFGAMRIGGVYEAQRWRDNLAYLSDDLVDPVLQATQLRMGFAAIELLAVFMLLYFFSARRKVI